MKQFVLSLSALAAAAIVAPPAHAWRTGPLAAHTGSPQSFFQTCRNCHGNNTGAGDVQILDLPAQYSPNQIYDIRVRVHDPAKLGAGFELSAENEAGHVGTLILSEPEYTRFAEGSDPQYYVCHSLEGVERAVENWAAMGAAAEFTLQWRAPAADAGVITFYAAGNAINNNLASSGDTIYTTAASITFENAPACPADLDGDGAVSAADLAIMLGSWGPNPGSDADLNGDNTVSAPDLALLLGAWGPCP